MLRDNPEFHRNERTDKAEEETYEYEMEYLQLIAQDKPEVRARALEEYKKEFQKRLEKPAAALGVTVLPVPTFIPQELRDAMHAQTAEKFFSPFDGFARDNQPWVRNDIKDIVRGRTGGKVQTQVAPTATALKSRFDAEAKYLQCIRAGLLAHMQGYPPAVSVEFARKALLSDVRPTFYEVEEAVSALPAV